ncbi:MAG: MarR family transcriptional regulator [Proteobacteria bacterium]|nr:MarR family transcriptional regulator [Pseudomonadota bacterium]
MNLKKVLTRFALSPDDHGELRRVARALGNELPRHRLDVLRSFRSELARMCVSGASYAAGYVAGMLDVTAEYESTVRKGEEDNALRRVALREGWREVLVELRSGPRLPSELSSRLGRDRSTITRTLRRLRASGLVQATSDSADGRTRPHRLTAEGRRVVASLSSAIPGDVERGISIAVHLLQYLLEHGQSPASALDTIAEAVLGDADAASAAVSKWASESERAGIVSTERDLATGSERYHVHPEAPPLLGARATLLWERVSSVLDQRKRYKDEPIPIYVRTGEEGWAAWAHALRADEIGSTSRTIVNGDLMSGAVAPPDERFDLLYDDPAAIRADRDEPTMQAFMEQADSKFVVTCAEADVPEGFIQLRLDLDSEAQ